MQGQLIMQRDRINAGINLTTGKQGTRVRRKPDSTFDTCEIQRLDTQTITRQKQLLAA